MQYLLNKIVFFTFLYYILLTQAVYAACDLQITTAGPCLEDAHYGIPAVGDTYCLRVDVNVTGSPAQPFRIKWTIANVTDYFDNITIGSGNGYWWYFCRSCNLDDPIPWSVTLDPDGVTGDTDSTNNTVSSTFTPTPPETAVELYNSLLMRGTESNILRFQSGSGTISNLRVIYGVPTSHGTQQVIAAPGPSNAHRIVTEPNSVPVFEIARENVPAGDIQDGHAFIVWLSSVRVNPDLLRQATWDEIDTMSTEWTQWLAPDSISQSDDPLIEAFVQQSLPLDFRTILTPYDTARQLHMAVMKALKYLSPASHSDAVNVMLDGGGDCGGFSVLLVACLRNAGIPARIISGFWAGDSAWHVRVEFHLPGVEWLVADPTVGQGEDPTGSYAWEFGSVPDSSGFVAVDTGGAHQMDYGDFTNLQVPNWWWNGGATFLSKSATSSLSLITAINTIVLTDTSPDVVIDAGSIVKVYGTREVNNITIGSGAEVELFHFPGENIVILESTLNLFSVFRSGATVVLNGSDGTKLKIPATMTPQLIIFDDTERTLIIDSKRVILGEQVITMIPAAIE